MRVHEVKVENFRGIESRRFSFCDGSSNVPRRLSVLVGPNTSGKTTILDSIHLAIEVVSNLDEPRLRPDFHPGAPALRTDPNLPIRVELSFSLSADEVNAIRELQRLLGDPPVDVADMYVVAVRWPPKEGVAGIKGVLEHAEPRGANFALRGRALARIAKARRLVTEAVFERIGGLLYLDQHRSVELAVPSTRTGLEEQLREDAGSRDILPWLELQSRLHQKWDPVTQGPSAWSRIKARFAELATPTEIDDIKALDEGFDLRFKQGGHYYYSAGLSYGQSQILRLVTNLTAFRASRSIILIDEVELHLHPSWQRRLLQFMRKGGGDGNQFIVSTHSESLVKYLHPGEVVALGALDDGQ